MRINVKECTDHISIGKTGENIITEVVFPDYEGFSAALTYQRPGETPYPIALTRAEGGWLWTVTNTELAVPGWGWSEVVYTEGEAVKLSKTYRVVIGESLEPAGEVPSGWESYYEDIIEAGNNAQTAAGEAKASSANAEQSEVNAAGSAVVAQSYAQTASEKATDAIAYARSAASSATSAKERADLADGFAKVAQSAATEALTSATNANASASQAAASADEAEQKADAVLDLTVSAKGLPEGATPTAERSIVGEYYNIDFGIPAGATGAKGDKGDAGFSPTATVTQDGDITTIEVTDEEGTTSAEIDLSDYMRKEDAWALLPTDTASGAVASFPDGADNVPIESLTVTIEPVQEGSGDPSPDNVRPISGWTAAGVTVCGKNLFDKNNYHSIFAYFSQGVIVANNAHTLIYMPCKEGVTYTAWRLRTSINERFGMCFTADIPKNGVTVLIGSTVANSGTVGEVVSRTLTAPEGAHYLCLWAWWSFSDITEAKNTLQIELGSTATAYEPYNGETITHEFKDAQGNTLTVYGGEDEVVKGKLRVTQKSVMLDDPDLWVAASGTTPARYAYSFSDRKLFGSSTEGLICSAFPVATSGTSYIRWRGANDFNIGIGGGLTLDQIKAMASSIQVVYELATPLEYDLTREDLRTLYGDNTIFADCGDVSVNYRADVQRWVEKKLAE